MVTMKQNQYSISFLFAVLYMNKFGTFVGGLGKRAWNSGFSGGMGKRAWNSGFTGGLGKRAWNSGFTGHKIIIPLDYKGDEEDFTEFEI